MDVDVVGDCVPHANGHHYCRLPVCSWLFGVLSARAGELVGLWRSLLTGPAACDLATQREQGGSITIYG